MPDGSRYQQDGREVMVHSSAVQLTDGTLAGSALTMDRALYNFARAVEQPIETIWPVSSLNAARSIGLANRTGSLEIGKDADVVLVDESVNVHLTIARGAIVYRIGM
jgi:N-acetylglucosamine-6-phosphate deacetylase